MNNVISTIPPWDSKTGLANVVIETPKNSQVKYAYDEKSGLFILSKILPVGMVFPFNFGFIPNTLANDGDALDMLILNDEPMISGCLLKVLPLAVIKATQVEKKNARPVQNDRIVGQAINNESPLEFKILKLEEKSISQIEKFFANYNEFYGKKFKVSGVGDRRHARKLIQQAIRLYQHRSINISG